MSTCRNFQFYQQLAQKNEHEHKHENDYEQLNMNIADHPGKM